MTEWKELVGVIDKIMERTKGERKKMEQNYDRFAGQIWDESKLRKHDSRAFINMEFATVESIAPMLTDNPPVGTLVPRQGYLNDLAGIYNNALKYAWSKTDMGRKTLMAVMDAMIAKVGIFQVYFDFEADELAVDVVDPRNFFIAPGYDEISGAPLCGTKELKPVSWILSKWPKTKKIKVVDSPFDNRKGKEFKYGDTQDMKGLVDMAYVYKVWMTDTAMEDYQDKDGKKGRRKKFPNGKLLYGLEEQQLEESQGFVHGLPPFVELYDYIRPHNFLGIAEGDQIEGLSKELNLQLQYIMGHVRKYHDANIAYDTAQFSDQADIEERFHKGGELFAYDSSMSQNPGNPISFIAPPPLNAAIPNFYNLLIKAIEIVSGSTDVSRGMPAKKERQSASEVAIQFEASHTRTRQRIRNLEWSLKKVIYQWVRLMQENYTKLRDFHTKSETSGTRMWDRISNSRAFAQSVIAPNAGDIEGKKLIGKELTKKEQQEWDDYTRLIEKFGEKDPVYFDFDVEIETNSTLPMDKQSLANLAMRLFDIQGIDREALLEILNFPKAREIIERMLETEQMEGPQERPRMSLIGGPNERPNENAGGNAPV